MSLLLAVSYLGQEYASVRPRRWPYRIGRSAKADLCLSNTDRVSRQHAEIVVRNDAYWVITLGRNPTFVNGEELTPGEPRQLHIGDEIELPEYKIQVRPRLKPSVPLAATRHMSTVDGHLRLVRYVAGRLDLNSWSSQSIKDWLQENKHRKIWLTVSDSQLCLTHRISANGIAAQLGLFDELVQRAGREQLMIAIER